MSIMKFAIIMGFLAVSSGAKAQDRCPAGSTGCTTENAGQYVQDRVNQGYNDVQEANTASERAEAVRDTVEECLQCGMDAVSDGISSITGDTQK